MKSSTNVTEYIANHSRWEAELQLLHSLMEESELQACIKWGAPTYTFNGKNVVGLAAFQQYVGLWFHQGALLSDKAKVLINAQEGVTKALRQWRFQSIEEIEPVLVKTYLLEAIENEKQGKRIKPAKKKAILIPAELQEALDKQPLLKERFKALTQGKQREYSEHIDSAKKAETRANRLAKCIPLIEHGKGLNDKYRK